MPISLHDADQYLLESVLHAGDTSYSTAKRHRALRGSGQRLMRESQMDRDVAVVPVAQGASEINIAATVPGFLPGYLFESAYVTAPSFYRQVRPIPLNEYLSLMELNHGQIGPPEMIHYVNSQKAFLFPTPDQAYSLHLPWQKPLVDFEVGSRGPYVGGRTYMVGDVVVGSDTKVYQALAETTNDDPVAASGHWFERTELNGSTLPNPWDVMINIPDQYIDDWIRWGAGPYLLYGLPGHPEAGPSMQMFETLIHRAKGDVQLDGVWDGGMRSGYGNFDTDQFI